MKLTATQMSAFLMYRMINPQENTTVADLFPSRIPVHKSEELENYLKERVSNLGGKTALALSGGIDSAILAKFMPKGSTAYTFKCVVPGTKVTDETIVAGKYAEQCGLKHKIIEVYWEDFEKYAPILMRRKNAPIHSIEVQIHKAALVAKRDGIDTLVFGEAADAVYGGLNGLLSQDWTIGQFIERYSFVMPYRVLKNPGDALQTYRDWEREGRIDPHEFVSKVFINESVGSYTNAISAAGLDFVLPYPETYLAEPIDYERIRRGENKYLVREIFQRLYPNFVIPPKTPMPRPMNEWLKDWEGPKREEFWPHCTEGMTGDQKWLVWCLEKFLDMCDT